MTINLAYLRSLETYTDELGVQVFPDTLAPAIAGLQRYVDGAPTDVDGRVPAGEPRWS